MSASASNRRVKLTRLVKYLALIIGAVILFVLFDFSIDFRPAQIHSSYQFNLSELTPDKPVFLRQDNLLVVVIRRSSGVIDDLQHPTVALQDPQSTHSVQPDYASNSMRSKHPEYFIAYALGTDLGCALQENDGKLQEICGKARYDFAGRALIGDNEYQNLAIPDHYFSNNFNTLTVKP